MCRGGNVLARITFYRQGSPHMASSLAPVIRPEGPEDYSAIADVVREAFGSDTEVELVEAIRRLPGYRPDLALIAVVGGRIVGHVMISGASLHDRKGRHEVVTLSPLAVSPICQGHGIGSALVNEAI